MISLKINAASAGEVVIISPAELPTRAPTVTIFGLGENSDPTDGPIDASGEFQETFDTRAPDSPDISLQQIKDLDRLVGGWGLDCFSNLSLSGLSYALPSLFVHELKKTDVQHISADFYDRVFPYLTGKEYPDMDPRLAKLFSDAVLLGIWSEQGFGKGNEKLINQAVYADTVSTIIAMQILALSNLGNANTLRDKDMPLQLRYYAQESLLTNEGVEMMTPSDSIKSVKQHCASFNMFLQLYIERFSLVDPMATQSIDMLSRNVTGKILELLQSGKVNVAELPTEVKGRYSVYSNIDAVNPQDLFKS